MALMLTSPEFENNQPIPQKFTCQGENINPPLQISGVLENTKSLVLVVDDPDAATDPDGPGKTFDHWILFNIDPQTTVISENSSPANAINGANGAGQPKYTGPCPPNGTHRYFFKLYALDKKLDLSEGATKKEVETATKGRVLEQTELVGTYQKQ